MVKFLSVFLAALLINISPVVSQVVETETQSVNLFDYGRNLSSANFDFHNFKSNFAACISNSNEIDFLTCEYIGKIESREHAMGLVNKNIYHGAPAWGTSSMYKVGDENSFVRMDTDSSLDSALLDIENMVNTIATQYIQTGDDVYLIKFVSPDLNSYNYYVFFDSSTHRVITKGNIFSFPLPLWYIEHQLAIQNSSVIVNP